MSMNKERINSTSRNSSPTILIVDDEPDIIELLELTLARMGMEVFSATTLSEAKALLQSHQFQLCFTDMRLPDGEGLELVNYISDHCSDLPVAIITAYGTTENAVAALKAGAYDYLPKPVALKQLRDLVKSALSLPPLQTEAPSQAQPGQRLLLGESLPMRQLRATIDKLSRSQASVYISGESGSGKELAARMIHEKSARYKQAFIAVNCGAIPENLMESEFFGYKKGAFTGAEKDHDGFFLSANGGTLFLDEVADLPLGMQVKLLRVIQEKRVRRIGETQEKNVDVRIISATHKKLNQCVESGLFRQDLYYRLNVIELNMPALREMREDIPLIAKNILTRLCRETSRSICELKKDALTMLINYDYPGNVRELENILERTLALCPDIPIGKEELQLPAHEPLQDSDPPADTIQDQGLPLQDFLDNLEKDSIVKALNLNRYNRTKAAKTLGITVRSLRYRMERLGLNEQT
ncbi:sigma-54-dependent Fis family transcriptional regulator [Nitrosomonas sp. JL21]|uniref:sigma-54-dependent transcriptional regulator n=1 Tax=Nitrosomonas sp. JL21 TaxID=153949 RepID=UPI0013691A7D|nr:sigma-54 dependent transcriptional regulator [Nitrosomonas sp. JL21]MBL8498022.1 sigma-54-dependent Fis family transcriptional regulator [Nitrosomonas sp.]MCC7090821.1 sigma-54-dependent Fis family transcriptional regulator [Nitrosomonas sp.]MXS78737.1 sigma-54-dependent Fis family transcriptional regulator [Nitrosomonas sp. JL21]